MSRKVTLQVFGTNAPANTRQPAEYITDVQSVEMVLGIGRRRLGGGHRHEH